LEKEHEELKELKFVIPTTYAIKLGKIGVFK